MEPEAGDVLVRALTLRAALLRYEGGRDAALAMVTEAATVIAATSTISSGSRCNHEVEWGRLSLETADPDVAEPHLQAAADVARSMSEGPDADLALAPDRRNRGWLTTSIKAP